MNFYMFLLILPWLVSLILGKILLKHKSKSYMFAWITLLTIGYIGIAFYMLGWGDDEDLPDKGVMITIYTGMHVIVGILLRIYHVPLILSIILHTIYEIYWSSKKENIDKKLDDSAVNSNVDLLASIAGWLLADRVLFAVGG